MNSELLVSLITEAPPLIFSVILHEIAHALVAERLGDPTARNLGRITLNPLKHIDPFMTIILPGILILSHSPAVFGGAKAVPVDPSNFKNPRKGMGIVAVAGPITNLVLAACFIGLLKLYLVFPILAPISELGNALFVRTLQASVLLNVVLALFNLIPLPPLDGGRIAVALLPLPLARKWAQLERYGLLILFILLSSGSVDSILSPVLTAVFKLIDVAP